MVASPEEVLECWNYLFLPRVCSEVLGDPALDAQLRESIDSAPDPRHRDARCGVASQEVWDLLRRAAKAPPSDPALVVSLIAEDRRKYDLWHKTEQTRRTSVMTAQTNAGTPNTKAAAAPKEQKAKLIAGHAPTAKIAFGVNKDGKTYNATDNNPKRAGTKSGDRFAKYSAGMTLESAVKAGVTPADIKWDVDHKFITVS